MLDVKQSASFSVFQKSTRTDPIESVFMYEQTYDWTIDAIIYLKKIVKTVLYYRLICRELHEKLSIFEKDSPVLGYTITVDYPCLYCSGLFTNETHVFNTNIYFCFSSFVIVIRVGLSIPCLKPSLVVSC